jgi:hypothetical protein
LRVVLETVDHYTLLHRLVRRLDTTVASNEISWFQNLSPILVVGNFLIGQDRTCKIGNVDFDFSPAWFTT